MISTKPRHIVCAVRGGPESRATITHAIDLALQYKARLTFLHVLDAEFLGPATVGPLSIVYNELVEMGKFTMLILCDRAERRGVKKVDYVVREGSIRKQLRQYAIETRADLMVMGRPTRSPGSNVFKPVDFETFINTVAEDGNIKMIPVSPAA